MEEGLKRYVVGSMRKDLLNNVNKMESILQNNVLLDKDMKKFYLEKENKDYLSSKDQFESWGYEFPGIQKQYEEMLPEINEYLGVKTE